MKKQWLIFSKETYHPAPLNTQEIKIMVSKGEIPLDTKIAHVDTPNERHSILDMDHIFDKPSKEPTHPSNLTQKTKLEKAVAELNLSPPRKLEQLATPNLPEPNNPQETTELQSGNPPPRKEASYQVKSGAKILATQVSIADILQLYEQNNWPKNSIIQKRDETKSITLSQLIQNMQKTTHRVKPLGKIRPQKLSKRRQLGFISALILSGIFIFWQGKDKTPTHLSPDSISSTPPEAETIHGESKTFTSAKNAQPNLLEEKNFKSDRDLLPSDSETALILENFSTSTSIGGGEHIWGPLTFESGELENCQGKCQVKITDSAGQSRLLLFFADSYLATLNKISGNIWIKARKTPSKEELILVEIWTKPENISKNRE